MQVSVVAEEVSTCVSWPRMRLERVLRHRPALKVVLDCLIGQSSLIFYMDVKVIGRYRFIQTQQVRVVLKTICEDSKLSASSEYKIKMIITYSFSYSVQKNFGLRKGHHQ